MDAQKGREIFAEMNDKTVDEQQTDKQTSENCPKSSEQVVVDDASNKLQITAVKSAEPIGRFRPAARAIVLLRRAATTLIPAASTTSGEPIQKTQSRWRRYQWHKLHHSAEATEPATGSAPVQTRRAVGPGRAAQPYASNATTTSSGVTSISTNAPPNSFLVPKTNTLKLPIVCHIRSIDGSLLCEIYVHRFELGQYIIDSLKVSLGLRDFKYFGLKLVDDVNEQDDPHRSWLDPNERVVKQIGNLDGQCRSSSRRTSSTSTLANYPTVAPNCTGGIGQKWLLRRRLERFDEIETDNLTSRAKSASLDRLSDANTVPKRMNHPNEGCKCVQMFLRIKYYPPNVPRAQDTFLRNHLWLQLRRDLSLGKLTSSMNNLILLMACVIQHELGDFDQELADSRVHQLNILPNQDLIEEQAIEVWRDKFKGLRKSQVQMQFLRAAIILETYGFDYYAVRDHQRQRAYLLGFNYAGVKTIRNGLIVHHFRWYSIQKVSQERRMIIFHIYQAENSKRKQIIGFKCPSNEECRTLYLRLLEQKYFFTVDLAYTEVKYPSSQQSISPTEPEWIRKSSLVQGVDSPTPYNNNSSSNNNNIEPDQSSDSIDFELNQPIRSQLNSIGSNQSETLICTEANCAECRRLNNQQVYSYSNQSVPITRSTNEPTSVQCLNYSQKPQTNLPDGCEVDVVVHSRPRKVGFSQQEIPHQANRCNCEGVFWGRVQSSSLDPCDYCLDQSANTNQVDHLNSNQLRKNLFVQEASTMTEQRSMLETITRYYYANMIEKLRQLYLRNMPVFVAISPFFRLCMLILMINLLIRFIDSLASFLMGSIAESTNHQSRSQQSPSRPVILT